MRILFVAFPNSIHSVRWINQITDQGWELHLVPSIAPFPLAPDLQGKVIFHGRNRPNPPCRQKLINGLAQWPINPGSGYVHRIIRQLEGYESGTALRRIIDKIKPDIVHSMEMQKAGYVTLAAKELIGDAFPTWLMSNWGSDVYLFHRVAEHQARVKRILELCDYYACECQRDVTLAKRLGLRGKILPVIPCAGGFDLVHWHGFRQPGPTSSRRVILLKGYQHWAGRALAGLRAIELCADVIRERGYRVLIQLASEDIMYAIDELRDSTGISIEISPRSSYEETMGRFGQARVHIGLSISDGISQSLLESMVMGAFPIQSNTACANEWIEDGRTGMLVPPQDPQIIAQALRRVLTDDELVDQAAAINDQTAQQRLDYPILKEKVISLYQQVFEEGIGFTDHSKSH